MRSRSRVWPAGTLLRPLSTEFDQPFTIELRQFHCSQGLFQCLQNSSLRTAGRAADLVHVFDVKIDDVAERADLYSSLWFRRSAAVNVALQVERPILTVLATAEGL